MEPTNGGSKVIAHMAHGGHAIADDAPGAEQLTKLGWTKLSDATQGQNSTTDFDYLFGKLVGDQEAHLPAATAAEVNLTVHALNDLGDLMIDQEPPAVDTSSPIPPVYTYWGQFIDHDLTAATDGDGVISIRDVPLPPLDADEVRRLLKNARNPALNLDSLYGDGPFAPPPTDPAKVVVPYQEDRAKLAVGRLRFVPVGVRIPPVDDMDRDLPRTDTGEPLVGDQRNDENLVVAQLHVAFLRFHNAVVDWVRAHEPERTSVEDVFYRAQQLTRWTYQWLSVHDYLKTVTKDAETQKVLDGDADLLGLADRPTYMPLEFSVAAFRFGHSMVRGTYDWNRNFGRPGNNQQGNATFDQMFAFTGKGGFRPFPGAPAGTALPSNWPAEWARLVDKDSLFGDRFARRIDTLLALPLRGMVNQIAGAKRDEITFDVSTLLKHLARRNLLRGFRLGLPTGQAVAGELGIQPIDVAAAAGRAVGPVLQRLGLATKTPLWYYILLESQSQEQGNTLGAVGSRIVNETIIGQIRKDPGSYLHNGWSPTDGVRLPDGSAVDSIPQFLRFAGVL